jgi:hypothetical protein
MLQEQNDIVWQNALFAGDDQITLQLPGVTVVDPVKIHPQPGLPILDFGFRIAD